MVYMYVPGNSDTDSSQAHGPHCTTTKQALVRVNASVRDGGPPLEEAENDITVGNKLPVC